MNETRHFNGQFRHPTPFERPSRGDVGDEHGFGKVYDIDEPTLTAEEMIALLQHEAVIERGLKAFMEVGSALTAIRNERLYRQTHETFKDYCRERWQISETYANRTIAASEVVANLKASTNNTDENLTTTPIGVVPANEAQARPLTSLPPEQQVWAWNVAVQTSPNGNPTAAEVQRCVDGLKATYLDSSRHAEIKPLSTRVTYGQVEDDYQPEVPEIDVDEDAKFLGDPAKSTAENLHDIHVERTEAETTLGGRGATVRLKSSGMLGTLAYVSGRIAYVDTINGRRQYYLDNVLPVEDSERPNPAAVSPIEERPPVTSPPDERSFNYKTDNRVIRPETPGASQPYDRCQTPAYALDPLLPYLLGDLVIWEPAAGEKLIVKALHNNGFNNVIASDILTGQNFLEYQPADTWDAIVTNPPYSLKFPWLKRCYELGKPFALLLPVETLGTKTAQDLFREYGIEIILMDKRINFKMPSKGWDAAGAPFPVAWFTWGLNIGNQLTFVRLDNNDDPK